jgi:hypothetical protein
MSNPIGWTDQTQDVRPIPGFRDYYATVDGDVLSFKRGGYRRLRPIQSRDGHLYVFLYLGRHRPKVWIHQAVLLAFCGQPEPGQEGRHLNGDPTDNHLRNLAWGTRQENADDRKRHGRVPTGERSGTHKLTEADVRTIRAEYGTQSLRAMARRFGVSHTAIRRAALGIKWACVEEAKTA